ncbi:hypothetical protein C1H46_035168 [Malus baccata]|uniref:HTH myb-type domain-containing protein n=1 Tax=Malus baccata TaxID=106549 RepID=A0A540KYH1_MALBA|nr:hypothetical protein C1H46_035168 [Malus baccata]
MIEEWMVSEESPIRFSLWKGRIPGRISPSFYPTASPHSRTMLNTGTTSDFSRFGSSIWIPVKISKAFFWKCCTGRFVLADPGATPKQIRELMKVDGLNNDEVKSHLQVCICD